MARNRRYEPEFKEKVLRLHLEEGRTIKSLTEEYNLGQGTLSYWLQQRRKECQSDTKLKEQTDAYEENRRLRKELAKKKERDRFPKKSRGILCKGNRVVVYQFIEKHHQEFGLRWLFRKLDVYPNGYYNYLKRRKDAYYAKKNQDPAQDGRNLSPV